MAKVSQTRQTTTEMEEDADRADVPVTDSESDMVVVMNVALKVEGMSKKKFHNLSPDERKKMLGGLINTNISANASTNQTIAGSQGEGGTEGESLTTAGGSDETGGEGNDDAGGRGGDGTEETGSYAADESGGNGTSGSGSDGTDGAGGRGGLDRDGSGSEVGGSGTNDGSSLDNMGAIGGMAGAVDDINSNAEEEGAEEGSDRTTEAAESAYTSINAEGADTESGERRDQNAKSE